MTMRMAMGMEIWMEVPTALLIHLYGTRRHRRQVLTTVCC